MEFRYWRGETKWELPSIDIESIEILAYIKFTKANVVLSPTNQTWWKKSAEVLPSLECSAGEVLQSRDHILQHLRLKYYELDGWLSNDDKLKLLPLKACIADKLIPAFRSLYWLDSNNFTEVSRSLFAQRCSYPKNFTYPKNQRDKYEEFIFLTQKLRTEDKNNIAEQLHKDAVQVINLLDTYLGDKNRYIFGSRASSVDAMLFSCLVLLLKLPLSSCKLQIHLKGKTNLCRYVTRILDEYFVDNIKDQKEGDTTKESTIDDDTDKYDWVLPVSVGAVAMVSYAVNIGLLQTAK